MMHTPADLFERYPEAGERLDEILARFFAGFSPAEQVELETAAQTIEFTTNGQVDGLTVVFTHPQGTTTLNIDAHRVGLHAVDGEILYVDGEP